MVIPGRPRSHVEAVERKSVATIIASNHGWEQWPQSFRSRPSTESCRVLAQSGAWLRQGRGPSRPQLPRPWWRRHRSPFRQEWLLSSSRLRTMRAPSAKRDAGRKKRAGRGSDRRCSPQRAYTTFPCAWKRVAAPASFSLVMLLR
jgi:hypothetical protein